jgi:hypothetical protein
VSSFFIIFVSQWIFEILMHLISCSGPFDHSPNLLIKKNACE